MVEFAQAGRTEMHQLIVDVILGPLDGFHRAHEISPGVHVVAQDLARTCDNYLFV